MSEQTREEELRGRISRSLAAYPGDEGVVLAWQAYLGACAEWDVISLHAHGRLADLLPKGVRVRELEIVMIGPPDDDEGAGGQPGAADRT